jgi:hypothetical protein
MLEKLPAGVAEINNTPSPNSGPILERRTIVMAIAGRAMIKLARTDSTNGQREIRSEKLRRVRRRPMANMRQNSVTGSATCTTIDMSGTPRHGRVTCRGVLARATSPRTRVERECVGALVIAYSRLDIHACNPSDTIEVGRRDAPPLNEYASSRACPSPRRIAKPVPRGE